MTTPSDRSTGASRTLTAYAFLAQATVGQTDLLRGLAPLFRPIAKANAGKPFDPKHFSSAVAELYGFRMHPWALEDFAPRLAEAGILTRITTSPTTHDYVFAAIADEFIQLSENDIAAVIYRFVEYARPLLIERGVGATDAELEGALLTALTDLEFIDVLLRPETSTNPTGRKVLTMRREPEVLREDKGATDRARLDVLCAGFILHAYRTDRGTYDLLTQVVSGALITEVVLEFQTPTLPGTLEKLTVVLDAPFLMSLLDLGTEEAHEFAKDVVGQLKAHGARVATFRHCAEEIRDNLTAVMGATRDGIGRGPTARRLKNAAFAAYAGAIHSDPETRLNAAGIPIVELLATERWYQNLTQQDEDDLADALGHYENPIARTRDASSVAATIRFRKGIRTRMARFDTAGMLFVTENPRLVRASCRLLAAKKLYREGEVPPVITDRYLAGLLWALFGGTARDLAPKLLLANCAAALEPRNDLLTKMHRFMKDLNQEQADYFTALMTTERAAQHLMELTLGDSDFLTRENAAEVLDRLAATLVEKQQAAANEERQALVVAHVAQVSDLERQRQDLEARLRDEEVRRLEGEAEQARLARDLKDLGELAEKASQETKEQTRLRLQRIAGEVHRVEQRTHYVIAGLATIVIVIAGLATSANLARQWTALGWFVTALCAFVGFWKTPELLFGAWISERSLTEFAERCQEENLDEADARFIVDLSAGTVQSRDS
jgi:hypothetical protein